MERGVLIMSLIVLVRSVILPPLPHSALAVRLLPTSSAYRSAATGGPPRVFIFAGHRSKSESKCGESFALFIRPFQMFSRPAENRETCVWNLNALLSKSCPQVCSVCVYGVRDVA